MAARWPWQYTASSWDWGVEDRKDDWTRVILAFWDELTPISQHEVVVDCESAFHRFIVAVDSMGPFGPDDYGPELPPRFLQPRMTAHDRLPLCDEYMKFD